MEEVLSALSERTKDESPESDVCSYADTMSSSASPASSASLADRAPRGTLTPGTLSPERHVPASIERPEYMFHNGPERVTASEIKDAETIERIRVASRLAARALAEAAKAIAPGVTTDELDRIAHEYLCDHGAYPSCLGYMGFPKSICTSINEVICHGIPDSTRLNEGDLINLDVTAYIEAYAKRFDYGVVRDDTGHGVGEAFHSGLIIPHYDAAPLHDDVIETGMVFTIEPMLTLGSIDWEQWDDGWTVVTKDRSRTAQFEHTLVVTDDGAEILTLP